MPKFKEILAQGVLLPMNSSLPEVSSVAWTSFMTGKNPGEHGIFGFMEVDRQSYEYRFPNFLSLKTAPFWETMDLSAVAFNIPQTYPARPTKGVIVSGFVALDLFNAVYPPRVYDYLKKIDYHLDVNTALAIKNPEAFFQDLFQTYDKRIEAVRHLFHHEEWQAFIAVVTETDRMHHFFFDSARGGEHHDIFINFYKKLDDFIYEMFIRAQQANALFMTCSDHGFTPIRSEVYVNRLLSEKGFLKLSAGATLSSITSESQAFCLEPSRVYIHLKDKYARGGVSGSDYEKLRQNLKELFASLTYNGHRAVKEVFFKEEIFSGPYLDEAPDLYVLGMPGFDLKANLKKDTVFGHSHFRGAHTYEDAHLFICNGPPSWNETIDVISIDKIAQLIKLVLSSQEK